MGEKREPRSAQEQVGRLMHAGVANQESPAVEQGEEKRQPMLTNEEQLQNKERRGGTCNR